MVWRENARDGEECPQMAINGERWRGMAGNGAPPENYGKYGGAKIESMESMESMRGSMESMESMESMTGTRIAC